MKILLITTIIFISCIQNLYSEDIYFVVGSKINLYSEPNTTSKIITQLEYAQIIDSYEMSDIPYEFNGHKAEWIKIKSKNTEGYILDNDLGYVTNIKEIPPLFLTLELINGNTLKIQNKPYWSEAYEVYELLSYIKDIGFYVVRERLIEGSFTFLISDIDGKRFQIIGDPIISPDKKQLLVLSSDIYAQFDASGVEIYSIENNIPVIKYKNMGDGESDPSWSAKNGKWISNSEVEYTKETRSDNGKEEESQVKLKKINGKWVE